MDPLWGTETLAIVHDGIEHISFEKLQAIPHERVARQNLRVCWENQGGAYNCCRCEKCIRTMVCLTAVGVLDQFETFHVPLNLALVARTHFNYPSILRNTHASMALLVQQPRHEALLATLHETLARRLIQALMRFPGLYTVVKRTAFSVKLARALLKDWLAGFVGKMKAIIFIC